MPDDLCDLCYSSGVTVERTTWCGKTIGVECGCEETCDGTCDDPACEACEAASDETTVTELDWSSYEDPE